MGGVLPDRYQQGASSRWETEAVMQMVRSLQDEKVCYDTSVLLLGTERGYSFSRCQN
jgi:hypothetical protein